MVSLFAILGGAKVSGKLEVIDNLLGRVDALLGGGAMAYTFFLAQGLPVGRSLVEPDLIETTRRILDEATSRGVRLELPRDHVVAPSLDADTTHATLAVDDPAIGERLGVDIGPTPIARSAARRASAPRTHAGTPSGALARAAHGREAAHPTRGNSHPRPPACSSALAASSASVASL